jgi:hypothetical protein
MSKETQELMFWKKIYQKKLMAYALGVFLSLLSLLLAFLLLPSGETRWPLLGLLSLLFGSVVILWSSRFEDSLWRFQSLRAEMKRRKASLKT